MHRIFLLLLACAAVALPRVALAQSVQRCIGADGRTVFTDRRCEDVGAVKRLPPAAATQGADSARNTWPRRLSQLVGEISAAIQTHDTNRLSAIYDWRGGPSASATRLFDQLDAMVQRPLVDIAPVYGQSDTAAVPDRLENAADAHAAAASVPAATGPGAWMPSWNQAQAAATGTTDTDTATDPAMHDPTAPAQAAPSRPQPVALRIEQTLGRSATPVRTVLGLRRVYGCFWISL